MGENSMTHFARDFCGLCAAFAASACGHWLALWMGA